MTIRSLNALGRFALELCALAALAWWGAHVGPGRLGSVALGIAFPALAAVAWGNFVAPRAPRYLPLSGRVAVEVAFFGTAAVGLAAMGHWLLAAVYGVVATANTALHHAWRQDDEARRAVAARPSRAR
ncbi:YrdB family protein [Streptodolium elevatio]|uniref:YrdB family protein n=1 Tax=Streptodolium elevatio TaxID=3157996 RepID=A0ABV3DKL9_9ACTN